MGTAHQIIEMLVVAVLENRNMLQQTYLGNTV